MTASVFDQFEVALMDTGHVSCEHRADGTVALTKGTDCRVLTAARYAELLQQAHEMFRLHSIIAAHSQQFPATTST